MEEENKKIKIIKTLVILIVLLVTVIGISVAYFSAQSNSNTQTIKTGKLSITYNDGTNNLKVDNIVPIYDKDMQTKANRITFNAYNEGTMTGYMDISIEDIVIPEELESLEFKWAIYETDENYTDLKSKVNNGNFRNIENDKQLLANNIKIEPKERKYYNLYIWIRETDLNQDEMKDKTFSGKIVIRGNQEEGQMLLSEKIKEDNDPIKEDKPDFSTTATGDEGLIKDIDEDGDTYYFRGAVENNYVKINGLTWATSDGDYHSEGEEMLWRIVRINGDNTIRLIADGSIRNSAFNEVNDDEKYSGYTYDNTAPNKQNGESSTIKKYLDNWYSENMMDYDKYIAHTRFCNDTTVASIDEDESRINYGSYDRIEKGQPSFECGNTTKNYGGEYDLKVGLITADEVAFAGGKDLLTSNESFYLYGKSDGFCTISPSQFSMGAGTFYIDDDGKINNYDSNNVMGTRLVINLKSDILYTSGNGTKLNPYTVGK